MKKHLILAAMATAAIFTACSNEDDNLETTGNEVTFVIGGVESRTTTTTSGNDKYETVFNDDEEVGLFSTGLATEMSNTSYTVSENGTKLTVTNQATFTYNGTNNATFYAYSPYQGTATDGKVTFEVSDDQNTNGTDASDFVAATAIANTGTVQLDFSHKLVLVEVDLTNVEGISSVTINDIYRSITYNGADGNVTTITEGENIKADIIMRDIDATETGQIYWAIIPAQTISSDATLFTITATNGKSYSYKTTNETTFTAGKIAKYTLGLPTPEATELTAFTPLNIVEWSTENSIVVSDGVIDENKLNLTSETMMSANITTGGFISTDSENTGIKWVYNATNVNTPTYDETEKYIKFTATATQGSWHNDGIAFKGGTNKINTASTYTLSFQARGSNTSSNLQVYLAYCTKEGSTTNNYIYEINEQNKSVQYLGLTTDWTQKTVVFNPAEHLTNINSGTMIETPHTISTFSIIFGIRSASGNITRVENDEFYIKDVSFVQN